MNKVKGLIILMILLTVKSNPFDNDDLPRLTQLEKENREMKMKLDSLYPYCKLQPDNICGPCMCKDDDHLAKKYYCDCQNLQPRRDCLEFYQYGIKINGIYNIHQNLLKTIQVYCDHDDGGGWTVFQRRRDGSVNFYRNWKDYKIGFGQLQNEFWLGNENIFTLSLQGMYPRGNELRIDMINAYEKHEFARYQKFQIGSEDTKYMLYLSDHSGTAKGSKSFIDHNGIKFTTYDIDNDPRTNVNCGKFYKGGWWFHNGCFSAYLNGVYRPGGEIPSSSMGIHWTSGTGFGGYDKESLTLTEMKIRRRL